MIKYSDPIEYLIRCCEQGLLPEPCDIHNAKEEINKLKQSINFHIVAWARINSRGDLYDPRFCYNEYIDESYLIPLYCNEKEFKTKYGKLSK